MSTNTVFECAGAYDFYSTTELHEDRPKRYLMYVDEVADKAKVIALNAACELAEGGKEGILGETQARAVYALMFYCEAMLSMFDEDVRKEAFATVGGFFGARVALLKALHAAKGEI